MKFVLLYDTNEADLAGDFVSFLRSLGLDVTTVIGEPNRNRTLSQKEREVLELANGLIFLLTPGSERNRVSGYASPSVCDEIGRAEQRFKGDLSKVIYLADTDWKAHALMQKAYIPFKRTDHRSMIRALRDVVNELREAGAFVGEAPPKKPLTIEELAARTSDTIKIVCIFVAAQNNTFIKTDRLDWFIRGQITRDPIAVNLIKMDLVAHGWLRPGGMFNQLSPNAMELVRYEKRKPSSPAIAEFIRTLGQRGPIGLKAKAPPHP